MVSRWCYQNRHTHRRTQNGRAQVACPHIDKHTRTQPDTLECRAVGPQRDLIVAAALEVIPGARFYASLSQCCVFVDIDWLHLGFLETNALRSTVTGFLRENLSHSLSEWRFQA